MSNQHQAINSILNQMRVFWFKAQLTQQTKAFGLTSTARNFRPTPQRQSSKLQWKLRGKTARNR